MKRLPKRALAALALAAICGSAHAHAYLVDSIPAKKQEVRRLLPQIKLTFSGKADALFSTTQLLDQNGSLLAEMTQPQASHEMRMPVPALQPGAYRIRYRVLSADGDLVEGVVAFEVVSEAANQTASAQ